MTKHSPDSEPKKSLHPRGEASRIAETLAKLSLGPKQPSAGTNRTAADQMPEVSEETVAFVIRARRERARYLPGELFIDPAWDMLLGLLHAEIAQRQLSIASLCVAPGIPQASAVRWLNALVEQGLVIRQANPADRNDDFVELTPSASASLRRYFRDLFAVH
jgi:CRP-like cAMP-binding protein